MTFAKMRSTELWGKAFTRLELIVVLATFCLLALLVLPLFGSASMRSNQTSCLSNLRQIGIGFQAWGNDHDDRRPWLVPMQEGGSGSHPFRNNAFLHYTFLSNYVSPEVLIDPAEVSRAKRVAMNWSSSQGGFLNPGFANNALSYMFSPHTSLPEATDILSSDRTVQFAGSGACSYGGGLQVQRLATGPGFRGWTNGLHGILGNVLVNDGHVEYATQDRLKLFLTREGDVGSDAHLLTPF
jgi:competence protein ComGC